MSKQSCAKRWLSFPLGTGILSNCHHHSSSLFKGSKEWVTIWQGLVGLKDSSEALFSLKKKKKKKPVYPSERLSIWEQLCGEGKTAFKNCTKGKFIKIAHWKQHWSSQNKANVPHEPLFHVGVNGLTCHDDPPPELSLRHIPGFSRRECSYNTHHYYHSKNLHNLMVYVCSHMLL